jgi:hypothetical protein
LVVVCIKLNDNGRIELRNCSYRVSRIAELNELIIVMDIEIV